MDSLDEDLLIKIISTFKLVEELENVPRKFFKKLTGLKLKMFEIRVEWKSNIYRFPCFFRRNKLVIVTHGFQKKTQKTPLKELNRAVNYMEDYIRRNK